MKRRLCKLNPIQPLLFQPLSIYSPYLCIGFQLAFNYQHIGMYRRNKEFEPVDLKPTKRFKPNSEETRVEQDSAQDPGCLRKFISNNKVIDLLQRNGVKALFPIQYHTYSLIYAGKDIKAKDKTGSGKTLAFSLPIIERFRKERVFKEGKLPKYLIMLPTRQLVIQVVANIDNLKLNPEEYTVLGIYGGDPIKTQTYKLNKGIDIAVATPGRLIDMVKRKLVDFSDIRVTCLDQADQMLKQGFQDDIETIFNEIRARRKEKTQNLLFSATFPPWVDSISSKYQDENCPMVDLVSKATEMPSTIKHYLLQINVESKITQVIHQIIHKFTTKKGKTIIFCETKRQVGVMADNLGKGCAMLHGDVKQLDRQRIYKDFKEGRLSIIVATNVAARGLDFPDIQLVIQTEPPRQVESFIHRSGRTGRAGKSGVNVLLYSRNHRHNLRKIQDTTKIAFQEIRMNDLN